MQGGILRPDIFETKQGRGLLTEQSLLPLLGFSEKTLRARQVTFAESLLAAEAIQVLAEDFHLQDKQRASRPNWEAFPPVIQALAERFMGQARRFRRLR